jgi:hypothetical protein
MQLFNRISCYLLRISFTMKKAQYNMQKKICLTVALFSFLATICSAQTLKIKKGDWWIGGGLGINGSVAPLGQYIGTAANLSIKGGYHVIDGLSVGVTITGAISIADKKEAGVYNRGISLLAGPIVQYMFPVTKTLYLAPTAAVTYGPIDIKSMTSAAGQPEAYAKVKGNAFCQILGFGPFFEVIPGRASFGAHIVYSFLQQTTNVYTNSGDRVPGTEIKDKKNGPGMIMEFKLHF